MVDHSRQGPVYYYRRPRRSTDPVAAKGSVLNAVNNGVFVVQSRRTATALTAEVHDIGGQSRADWKACRGQDRDDHSL